MSWLTVRKDPILESPENRVALSFLAVGYGVVFGAVFEQVLRGGYADIHEEGWSQLGLATAAIVFSWIGLFNNRAIYPVWRARFVNIQFVQFVLSVSILVGYWGLVVTAEGIPHTTSAKAPTSAIPEALLLAAIFGAYLAWDILELAVLSSGRHRAVLEVRDRALHKRIAILTKRAKTHFVVTLVFAVFFGAAALILWFDSDPKPNTVVMTLDIVGIVLLFAYRVAQDWFTPDEEPNVDVDAEGWTTLSPAQLRTLVDKVAGESEIIGTYTDAGGTRRGFVIPLHGN